MPYKINKLTTGRYRVSTPNGVKSRHTSKSNAEKQVRLLRGIDHGWKPTGKPARESLEAAQEIVDELLS